MERQTRVLLIVLLAVLGGCSSPPRAGNVIPEAWPLVCVENGTVEPLPIVATDRFGRGQVVLPVVLPGRVAYFPWPFTDSRGQILAGPHFTRLFAPWDGTLWYWRIGTGQVEPGASGCTSARSRAPSPKESP